MICAQPKQTDRSSLQRCSASDTRMTRIVYGCGHGGFRCRKELNFSSRLLMAPEYTEHRGRTQSRRRSPDVNNCKEKLACIRMWESETFGYCALIMLIRSVDWASELSQLNGCPVFLIVVVVGSGDRKRVQENDLVHEEGRRFVDSCWLIYQNSSSERITLGVKPK